LHGDVRVDDYAWLRSKHWQELLKDTTLLEPEIRHHLDEENAYTETVMADSEHVQHSLYEELVSRLKADDQSVPDKDGDYEYYHSYSEGKQHPIYSRRLIAEQTEEVLLDVNRDAEGKDYFLVVGFSHSPDHRYVAYCVDDNGSEYYTLYLRDTHSDAPAQPLFEGLQGDLAWSTDSRHLFYTRLNESHRPDSVCCYCIDDPTDKITLVYKEQDPGFFVELRQTHSRRFIVLHSHDHATSEDRLIPADVPYEIPKIVRARELNVEYRTEECRNKLIIYNNSAGAENFKLSVAEIDQPAIWYDIYVPGLGVLLENFLVFNDYLVCLERKDALTRIALMSNTIIVRGTVAEPHYIDFDEPCYEAALMHTFEYNSSILRFGYSSLKTPRRVYDYDMHSHRRTLRKEEQIPCGYDADLYNTQRLWAHTADGTDIPISLLHLKSTPLDGTAPLLLYAYGAYGFAVPATFSSHRLSLVNRGFIYAIAHVRGGIEKGFAWYRNAKFSDKKNTFEDFISCAEYLITNKISYHGGIAIQGGSAGGMTIGYAVNTAADLFKAAIADVPFVDVLNTMCDASLPLTPPEWQEWGNPLDDCALYHYMKSYSPYEQVAAQRYPHMLVTAGLTDPRVSYWEPAKWVAKLRAHKTDNNYLLLKVAMDKGHSGAAGRFDALKEIAFKYAFLLKVFGIPLK